jgi:HD-like signal output (HDOD) protein
MTQQGILKTLSPEKMIKKIEGVHELPVLATVSAKLNQLMDDIDTPAQQLADFVEKDQAIVAKILKLVNSSFYGFSTKVSNIRHAIMLMGYNTIRSAVLTISVVDGHRLNHKFKGYDISRFWEHAIAVATISRFIDRQTGDRFREDSFTSGLIHDIGKLFMANCFPEEFDKVLQTMQTEKVLFSQAEKRWFPISHSELGAYLAIRWNLPEILNDVIGFHHQPNRKNPCCDLVLIVHTADALEKRYVANNKNSKKVLINQLAIEKYGEQIQTVNEWLPDVKNEIRLAYDLLMG